MCRAVSAPPLMSREESLLPRMTEDGKALQGRAQPGDALAAVQFTARSQAPDQVVLVQRGDRGTEAERTDPLRGRH